MSTTDELRGELRASIERTLVAEARRNEGTIAGVRVIALLGMLGIEAWLMSTTVRLGSMLYPLVGLTVVVALWSIALWWSLRRGSWSPVLPWVIPVVDTLYVGLRQGGALWVIGAEQLADEQSLASMVAMAGVVTVTGAYRLSRTSVAFSAALGIGLYTVFAVLLRVEPFFAAIQLLLLIALALATSGLTHIVTRAVQSEVTRLTLSRLLPAPVLEAADSDPLALLSEPRSVVATVVVTDLRGFTKWAEHKQPLEVLAFLNTVQGALADVVLRHGGTVDKFMGDGMLAVFGAPEVTEDHAARAVVAAREMLEVVDRIGEVRLGVGVHSGEVVVGCLGSGVRMEFTVLGDTVNTASRLESATKEVGVASLVSAATRALLRDAELVHVGEVPIRGREQTVEVYSLPEASSM